MKPEKFTPIVQTEEQKAYEKLTKKEARRVNIDHLHKWPRGKISATLGNFVDSIGSSDKYFNDENIMRLDAEKERDLKDKISELSDQNAEGKKNKEEKERDLKKIENSTLSLSEKETKYGVLEILSGRIKGHNVVVKRAYHTCKTYPLGGREYLETPFFLFAGSTIDGVDLREEEAENIYNEYWAVANDRTKDILSHKDSFESAEYISKHEETRKAKKEAEEKFQDKIKMKLEKKANSDEEARTKMATILKDLGV